jgi:hypothetical protein
MFVYELDDPSFIVLTETKFSYVLCVENARVTLVHKKPERTVMTAPNCALGCLFLHDARVVLQDVNNIPKFCNTVNKIPSMLLQKN